MSRAFVKENDTGLGEDLGELPLSPHPNYVTARGLALLRRRLEALQAEPATEASPMAQRRLRWLQARVASAIPVAGPRRPDRAAFGATVKVREVDSQAPHSYRIVGEDEADPEQGRVSWVSPLARALDGAAVGDVVHWKRPAGDLEIEVLQVEYEQ